MSRKTKTKDEGVDEPLPESHEEPVDTEPAVDVDTPTLEDRIVNVAQLQAERRQKPPPTMDEQDAAVFAWYNSRSGGQEYTRREAADLLGITVEALNDSIKRLQHTLLPDTLGHFLD